MSVVITGVGLVSGAGKGADAFWRAYSSGDSSIARTNFGDSEIFASRVAETDFTEYLTAWETRKMDRMCMISTVAAKMAIADARLEITEDNTHAVGSILQTYHGSFNTNKNEIGKILSNGLPGVSPFWFPMTTFNSPLGSVARSLKLKGVSTALVGSDGLAYAKQLLENGMADAIVVVCADEIDELYVETYLDRGFLRTEGEADDAGRLYDGGKGIVYGEGWAAIVLEREEFARSRGARIRARLADAVGNIDQKTFPAHRRYRELSEDALSHNLAQLTKDSDGPFIVMGVGNGTEIDDAELRSLDRLWEGGARFRLANVRGTCGESFGVSGAVSVIAAVKAFEEGVLPALKSGSSASGRAFAVGERAPVAETIAIVSSYYPNGLVSGYKLEKVSQEGAQS